MHRNLIERFELGMYGFGQSHLSNTTSTDFNTERYNPIVCRTLSSIRKCMEIRYEVFCLQKGWEAAEAFPDQRETDNFDEHAIHILLRDRRSGKDVGSARVVFADPAAADANLPLLRLSGEFREKAQRVLPIARTFEVSRLAISKSALSEADQTLKPGAPGVFPALALIKGVLRATAFGEFDTSCMIVALSLKRLLERAGLRFHDSGIRVQHRGIRAPIYRGIPALMAELYELRPDVWRYLTDNGSTWPLDRLALAREREALPG
jgi:N-acyl amino acid synthase of PEP-CTERM/exosortase system